MLPTRQPNRSTPPTLRSRHALRCLLLLGGALLGGTSVTHAETTVELATEATRTAPNDQARANVFAEASGPNPGEPGKQVSAKLAEALRLAKDYAGVRVQSGGTQTYPTYGKVEGWRMRAELHLESSDPTVLSELLGKLQAANLGLSSLSFVPAPATRAAAEDAATEDAIATFKARAKRIATILGHPYTIKQLSVNSQSRAPGPLFRAAGAMLADATPMPIEAGQSQVTVTVTGQILLDK